MGTSLLSVGAGGGGTAQFGCICSVSPVNFKATTNFLITEHHKSLDLSHFIHTKSPWRERRSSYFIEEKTEAQRMKSPAHGDPERRRGTRTQEEWVCCAAHEPFIALAFLTT